ncbi:MAG: AAA family ATPase [Acidobacteriota bacterium]|nr:MAG: AAA family ATPase [Acidobacteriota bacterium]
MRIQSLEITDFPPIKVLRLENLGNTVIIAGANGSGKTRLREALVKSFQGNPLMNLVVESTRELEEERYFEAKQLEIKKNEPNETLKQYVNSRKYGRGNYTGSLVQIDSDRNIQTIQYSPVNWLGEDPDDHETPGGFYFGQFTNRWQDFMNYIHQKSAVRDKKLATEVKSNPKKTAEEIANQHPDPLEKYQEAFNQLLPNKQLLPIDPANPREFYYRQEPNNEPLAFRTLSSGEQEVVKIVFDVIRKDIKHSVIIVDEPELHLHPTLAFKLVETLKSIGDHTNQLIFLTHSADLISTYYSTGDVYFIDNVVGGQNQAHRLSELTETHEDLVRLMGENLGLFAVGKKLVFVEGENSSIDRLTYHSIAQKHANDVKIVPIGSVKNIGTLSAVEQQIRKTIFGIDLYMIRDRDGLSEEKITELESNNRIRCLKKRHIENYFLNSGVLAKVAQKLYITSNGNQFTQEEIEAELKRIAEDCLKVSLMSSAKDYLNLNNSFEIDSVKSLETKTTDQIKQEFVQLTNQSISKLADSLKDPTVKAWLDQEEERFKKYLETNEWKDHFDGKIIFSRFCGEVFKTEKIRVRQAYVDVAMSEDPSVFQDVIDIFESL